MINTEESKFILNFEYKVLLLKEQGVKAGEPQWSHDTTINDLNFSSFAVEHKNPYIVCV